MFLLPNKVETAVFSVWARGCPLTLPAASEATFIFLQCMKSSLLSADHGQPGKAQASNADRPSYFCSARQDAEYLTPRARKTKQEPLARLLRIYNVVIPTLVMTSLRQSVADPSLALDIISTKKNGAPSRASNGVPST